MAIIILTYGGFEIFLTKNITQKPASQYLHGALAVLVMYIVKPKRLQCDLKQSQ